MRPPASSITTVGAAAALLGSLALVPVGSTAATNPVASTIEQGKEIAFNRKLGNCLACHKMGDGQMPGNIGPPLLNMKTQFPNKARLFAQIYDAGKIHPGTIMPPFGRNHILTPAQIDKIIAYLYTL